MKKFLIVILFTVMGISLFGSCATLLPETPVIEDGVTVYYRTQPPYYGISADKLVNLNNNEAAVNPTWEELVSFLEQDDTDKGAYGFDLQVCAEFANELHDNAETAGIKSAWVGIEFEDNSEGHAFNAFKTIDRGLVFVDCTGRVPTDIVSLTSIDTNETEYSRPSLTHNDRIAYVEIGKKYGLIHLEYALSLGYGYYEDYQKEWDNYYSLSEEYDQLVAEFNQKFDIYNSEIESYNNFSDEYEFKLDGREVIKDPTEYAEISRMYDELGEMQLELKLEGTELDKEGIQLLQEWEKLIEELDRLGWYRNESPGIVSSVEIYW
ncbi:hypothetical protein ACFLXP_03575 [Chloroflexota bacterium]